MKLKCLFFNALLFAPSLVFAVNSSQGAAPAAAAADIGLYTFLAVVILAGGVLLGFKYRSGYKTAKGIAMLVSFAGWLLFAGGIVVVFFGLVEGIQSKHEGVSILAILPGLGAAIFGLLCVMGGQLTRAVVDTADHTREIMNILREKA